MDIHFYKISISGIVQGVGFRPFVYNLAYKHNCIGEVYNDADGVLIKIGCKDIEVFLDELQALAPPLAKITKITQETIEPFERSDFVIRQSHDANSSTTILSPDIAMCDACKKELFDPTSKRYKYPFINCTHCGVRYSIIKNLPYDRINTAMGVFMMCDACKKEYEDPTSRMFHAQPIGCNDCGVKTFLHVNTTTIQKDTLYHTAELLKEGKLGAIKAVGGFHLVCDATDENTVQKLRQNKHRPTKPLAILVKDFAMAKRYGVFSEKEKEVLLSKEAPIVLVKKNRSDLASAIAPGIDKVGIMVASNPLHLLLFEYIDTPLVATSANLSGEPIITTKEDIEQKLPFVDFILDYNREIINAIDDSVVQVVDEKLCILRLARGYAPLHLKLPKKIDEKVLALGANQKSTIAIAFEDNLILSPYIADLDTIESIEHFKTMIANFKRFYNFDFDVVLHDSHPAYESTKIAQTFDTKKVAITHHKAHLLSVMTEPSKCVSFVFDGTGLGEDGELWGGEVFVAKERKYHFKPLVLLGGEKAIKECYRVALSKLFEVYPLDEVMELELDVVKRYKSKIPLLYHLFQSKKNLKTSSVGRLFDMVASIVGVLHEQTYEGEAGLRTEALVGTLTREKRFEFTIQEGVIDIAFDFFASDFVERFYATLCSIVITLAKQEEKKVLFSGGVWQNKTLLEFVISELQKENIPYTFNTIVPINDSGISVGQIMEYING